MGKTPMYRIFGQKPTTNEIWKCSRKYEELYYQIWALDLVSLIDNFAINLDVRN